MDVQPIFVSVHFSIAGAHPLFNPSQIGFHNRQRYDPKHDVGNREYDHFIGDRDVDVAQWKPLSNVCPRHTQTVQTTGMI